MRIFYVTSAIFLLLISLRAYPVKIENKSSRTIVISDVSWINNSKINITYALSPKKGWGRDHIQSIYIKSVDGNISMNLPNLSDKSLITVTGIDNKDDVVVTELAE